MDAHRARKRIQSAPEHRTTLWIDSQALLVNETKRLINQTAGFEAATTDEGPIDVVLSMRADLYKKLTEVPFQEREDRWIDWLVENCHVEKNEIEDRLKDWKLQLQNLPQEMADRLNISPDKIEIREPRDLFVPKPDSSDGEKEFLEHLNYCYDRQLIERLNCAGGGDFARPRILKENGGLYIDTDMLPAIASKVSEQARKHMHDDDPFQDDGPIDLSVQSHLFTYHHNLVDPSKSAQPVDPNDDKAVRFERELSQIESLTLNDLFEPIGDIEAPQDLILLRHNKYGLDVNILAAHKDALGCELTSILQAEMMDYVERFNTAFNSSIEKSTETPLAASEIKQLRKQFFRTYSLIHPLPIVAPLEHADDALIKEAQQLQYADAIADYPFDGIIPGCGATGQLFATSTYIIANTQLFKEDAHKKIAEDVFNGRASELRTYIAPKSSQSYFCTKTELDEQHSWKLPLTETDEIHFWNAAKAGQKNIQVPFKSKATQQVSWLKLASALVNMPESQVNKVCKVEQAKWKRPVEGKIVKVNADLTMWIYQEGGTQKRPHLLRVPLNLQPPGLKPQYLNEVKFITNPKDKNLKVTEKLKKIFKFGSR